MVRFFKGFVYAFRGLKSAFRSEANLKFHLIAAILVVAAGFILHVNTTEWLFLILCISMVTGAELFNTAIEKLADKVTNEKDELIGFCKDAAAAGVLVTALGAAIIGVMIFLPKVLKYLNY